MGKTSSTVKNRYNAKAYDAIPLRVIKGQKSVVQAHAAAQGESVNGFINRAIQEAMERDNAARGAAEDRTDKEEAGE